MPLLRVEVVYALPERQMTAELELDQGATVRESIIASGILELHREVDLNTLDVGIWGKRVGLDCVLRSGDRVEIYRPLVADPKAARRQRARKRKSGVCRKRP